MEDDNLDPSQSEAFKEKNFKGTEEGTITQNQQKNQKTLENKIEGKTENDVNEAEEKLKEFFAKYVPKNGQKKIKETGEDVIGQWKKVDELNLYLFNPKDTSNMSEKDRKAYNSRIESKIKIYNAVAKVTLGSMNPYKIEAKILMKKSIKERDKLENNLDMFVNELKGVRNGKYSQFYDTILEGLPEHIVKNPNYSGLIDKIKNGSSETNENSLISQMRELKHKSRFLADLDDQLQASISEYDEQINGLKTDINKLNIQIGKEPGNKNFLKERSDKSGMLATYEIEQEKYVDSHHDVFEELTNSMWEFQYVSDQVDMHETAIGKTRQSLRIINNGIKRMQNYVKNRDAAVVFSDHLAMVDHAQQRGIQLAMVSNVGSTMAHKQLGEMINRNDNTPELYKSGQNYKALNSEIKTQEREQVEKFKQNIRQDLYK